MSYILDALRRADAERERGAVPTLNAPAWTPALRRSSRRWWGWAVAAALAATLAALTLLQLQGSPAADRTQARAPAAASAPASAAASISASVSASVSAAITATMPPPNTTAPAMASAPVLRHVPPLPAAEGPKPGMAAAPQASVAAQEASTASAALGAASSGARNTTAAATARKAAHSASSRVGSPAELPDPQRSALSRLSFGGGVHSADRAQSFVLLGGQIVHEGEAVASGITLERILPRSVLLRVGEQLVELKY